VSGALSQHRRPHPGGRSGSHCVLTVQAVFRDVDEQNAQTLAAEMIARAHELANQPECECDVDVSVHSAAPIAPTDEC
jgi:hypothetical protein